MSAGLSIQTWDNYWPSLSGEEKKDVLEFTSPWRPDPRIVSRGNFSKAKCIIIAMNSAHRLKKEEQLVEVYRMFASLYGMVEEGHSNYEKILIGILRLKPPISDDDRFLALNDLASYYRFDAQDLGLAIRYIRQAIQMIDGFMPTSNQDKLRSFSSSYLFLIQVLHESKLFDESERIEQEALNRGLYYHFDKAEEYLYYLHYLRLIGRINEGHSIEVSDQEIDSLSVIHPAYSANACAAIAKKFFERANYKEAKYYFEKALYYYPTLSGVKSRLKKIDKLLAGR